MAIRAQPIGLARRDVLLLVLGALIVASGAGLALWQVHAARNRAAGGVQDAEGPDGPGLAGGGAAGRTGPGALAARGHGPQLIGFKGHLELGGMPSSEDKPYPFVVGETLLLEVDGRAVDEYRWTCDGVALPVDGQEWSPRPDRTFPVDAPGAHRFRVEGRNRAGVQAVSLQREVECKGLKIASFESDLDPFSDRFLPGDAYELQVTMVEPFRKVEYRYRYSVNGKVVRNPEDKQEWSTADFLEYTFRKPGPYVFKVEVRRATEKEPEDEACTEELRVGLAVAEFLDASPANANVGATVRLESLVQSAEGDAQCRFGIKHLLPDQEYVWLPGQDGQEWGNEYRTWIPAKPGNYRIRVEVRPGAGKETSDFRELLYVVRDKPGDF